MKNEKQKYVEKLEHEYKNAHEEYLALVSERDELVKKYEDSRSTLAVVKSENAQICAERLRLLSMNSKLESDCEEAKKRCSEALARCKDMEDSKQSLSKAHAKLEAECERHKKTEIRISRMCKNIQSVAAGYCKENEELKARVKQLESHGNASAVAGTLKINRAKEEASRIIYKLKTELDNVYKTSVDLLRDIAVGEDWGAYEVAGRFETRVPRVEYKEKELFA